MRLWNLTRQMWNDDCGGVISSEYMMLFGVLTLGSASGLVNLRDSGNQEMQEVGSMIRETRQHYAPDFIQARQQAQTQPGAQQGATPCAGGVCP